MGGFQYGFRGTLYQDLLIHFNEYVWREYTHFLIVPVTVLWVVESEIYEYVNFRRVCENCWQMLKLAQNTHSTNPF